MKLVNLVQHGYEALLLTPSIYREYKKDIKVSLLGESSSLNENAERYFRTIKYGFLPKLVAGYLGIKSFDILTDREKSFDTDRLEIGKHSITLVSLNNKADIIIDKKLKSVKEKGDVLRKLFSIMFEGKDIIESQDLDYISANAHALSFYNNYTRPKSNLANVYDLLIKCTLKQVSVSDMDEALENAEIRGATYMGIFIAMTEDVTKIEDERRERAIRHFGSYAQLLDDLEDIDDDREEEMNTFPVLFLKYYGDSPANRRKIKETMLERARINLKKGIDLLESVKSQEDLIAFADFAVLIHLVYEKIVK